MKRAEEKTGDNKTLRKANDDNKDFKYNFLWSSSSSSNDDDNDQVVSSKYWETHRPYLLRRGSSTSAALQGKPGLSQAPSEAEEVKRVRLYLEAKEQAEQDKKKKNDASSYFPSPPSFLSSYFSSPSEKSGKREENNDKMIPSTEPTTPGGSSLKYSLVSSLDEPQQQLRTMPSSSLNSSQKASTKSVPNSASAMLRSSPAPAASSSTSCSSCPLLQQQLDALILAKKGSEDREVTMKQQIEHLTATKTAYETSLADMDKQLHGALAKAADSDSLQAQVAVLTQRTFDLESEHCNDLTIEARCHQLQDELENSKRDLDSLHKQLEWVRASKEDSDKIITELRRQGTPTRPVHQTNGTPQSRSRNGSKDELSVVMDTTDLRKQLTDLTAENTALSLRYVTEIHWSTTLVIPLLVSIQLPIFLAQFPSSYIPSLSLSPTLSHMTGLTDLLM